MGEVPMADSSGIGALVRYIAHDDREASHLVGQYIEANGARLARRRARAIPLHTKGKHHDLLAIFNELKHFPEISIIRDRPSSSKSTRFGPRSIVLKLARVTLFWSTNAITGPSGLRSRARRTVPVGSTSPKPPSANVVPERPITRR